LKARGNAKCLILSPGQSQSEEKKMVTTSPSGVP